jgi:hypothetical protein
MTHVLCVYVCMYVTRSHRARFWVGSTKRKHRLHLCLCICACDALPTFVTDNIYIYIYIYNIHASLTFLLAYDDLPTKYVNYMSINLHVLMLGEMADLVVVPGAEVQPGARYLFLPSQPQRRPATGRRTQVPEHASPFIWPATQEKRVTMVKCVWP